MSSLPSLASELVGESRSELPTELSSADDDTVDAAADACVWEAERCEGEACGNCTLGVRARRRADFCSALIRAEVEVEVEGMGASCG